MKRIPRDPEKFEVIDMVSAIGRKTSFKIGDEASEAAVLGKDSDSYRRARKNPALLHGRRTEDMFGYVAASLRSCVLVKEEDAGEAYVTSSTIRIPDYRLVTNDGYEFLVEVKNFHQSNPSAPFSLDSSYVDGLLQYAALLKKDLKFAVYWSRWNLWTLVSADKLKGVGSERELTITEALQVSEMSSLLGDLHLGTTPPLVLRLRADTTKPRAVEPSSSQVIFTIGAVEFYCAGRLIVDDLEKSLAFYLILYGDWVESESKADVKDGELVSIDFESRPRESEPKQEFEIIGSLSSMASGKYNDLTLSEGGVERLSPDAEPDSLVLHVPHGYRGKDLPLWRLKVEPPQK